MCSPTCTILFSTFSCSNKFVYSFDQIHYLEYAEYEYGACCVSIAKETAGTHTCNNDDWVKKKCEKMSDDALDKCKAHCWGDKECFKVCHPCGYKPDGGYKPDYDGGDNRKKVCKKKRSKCKKKCDRRRLGAVAAGEVRDFHAEGGQFHRELGSCKKKCKKEYKKCL